MRLTRILSLVGCVSLATAAVFPRQNDQTSAVSTTSTSSAASAAPASTDPYSDPDSGTGITGSGNEVNADGGASGAQSGSFNLSKGGLIAIIVVVAVVASIGIASTVLWIIAKRRQWNVRQSIKRASRRLTGRAGRDATRERQSKRVGMQMASNMAERGHKRAAVVQVSNAGRESQSARQGQQAKAGSTGKWSEKLWRNDWQK